MASKYQKIKSHYKDFKVDFNNKVNFQKRELFSIEKIKGDIGWYPKYDINKGIDDLIKIIIVNIIKRKL